jgi:hypothetical protein
VARLAPSGYGIKDDFYRGHLSEVGVVRRLALNSLPLGLQKISWSWPSRLQLPHNRKLHGRLFREHRRHIDFDHHVGPGKLRNIEQRRSRNGSVPKRFSAAIQRLPKEANVREHR